MEININLFHERPMFSFRCSKKNKKLLKTRAKSECRDMEDYIMKVSNYYSNHERKGFITLRDFLRDIGDYDKTPVKIKLCSDDTFEHLYNHSYDFRNDDFQKYMVIPVNNFGIELMENVSLGIKNVPGLCVLLID